MVKVKPYCVPRGSILGPLLPHLYFTVCHVCIKCMCCLNVVCSILMAAQNGEHQYKNVKWVSKRVKKQNM